MRLVCVLALAVVLVGTADARTKPPTKAELEAQTRAGVRRSGANLVRLEVALPNRAYGVVVKPAHPAPYLKYRARALVDLMNRLATRRHFIVRYFAVLGPSRQRVLWIEQVRLAGGEQTRWNIAPQLMDCVRSLNIGIEVDPDGTAPPCPAR